MFSLIIYNVIIFFIYCQIKSYNCFETLTYLGLGFVYIIYSRFFYRNTIAIYYFICLILLWRDLKAKFSSFWCWSNLSSETGSRFPIIPVSSLLIINWLTCNLKDYFFDDLQTISIFFHILCILNSRLPI